MNDTKPASVIEEGVRVDGRRQGGFAANPTFAREMGKKGGEVVKTRKGTDYFKEIGRQGGEKTRKERGSAYFSEIGRKGGLKRGENLAIAREKLPPAEPVQRRKPGRPRKNPDAYHPRDVALLGGDPSL